MVPLSVTLSDLWPTFHDNIQRQITRLIVSRVWSSQWFRFQWPWVTLNLDFKVTIFENGTRQSYIYNGRPIESRIWFTNGAIFNDLERPLTWFSRSCHSLTLNISQTATDTAIVTIEGEQETAPKLSNGTRFNDLEWSLSQISRSRYYSTSNNSKTVQHR